MMYRFAYEGNTPSKKNQKKIGIHPKTGRPMIYSSSAHDRWVKEAFWVLKVQMNRYNVRFPIVRCQHVMLKIYWADLRGRDNSNLWESVLDLAVKLQILGDDNWKVTGATYQFPFYRKGQPGWELCIETGEAEEPRTLEGGKDHA
jgi:hypothetical protein